MVEPGESIWVAVSSDTLGKRITRALEDEKGCVIRLINQDDRIIDQPPALVIADIDNIERFRSTGRPLVALCDMPSLEGHDENVISVSSMDTASLKAIVEGIINGPRRELSVARTRIVEYSLDHTVRETMRKVLDEAELFTRSSIGFFHTIDEDQTSLTLQAWSTRTVEQFCQVSGIGEHYPISQAGIWVECLRDRKPLIINDYPALGRKGTLPDGHAVVHRFIQCPIYRGDRAVAIIGVGNKETEYDEGDVRVLSDLADLTWEITKTRITEFKANQSLEFSQAVLNSLGAQIAVVDEAGIIRQVNSSWIAFGKSNGRKDPLIEDIGRNYLDICLGHQSNQQSRQISKGIRKVLNGELKSFEAEYPCETPDQVYWFRMVVLPLNSSGGGAVISHDDITTRKHFEQDLAVALSKYRTLFDVCPAGLVLTDRQGKIVECNQLAVDLLGLDPKTVRNRKIGDPSWVISRKNGTPMPVGEYASVRALQENCTIENVEMGLERPDGRKTWLNVIAKPIPLENYGVVVAFNDISERVQAEVELSASHNRFSALFQRNPSATTIIRKEDEIIVDVNQSWERLFGIARDEAIGRSITELGIWYDDRNWLNLLNLLQHQDQVSGFEARFVEQSGTVREMLLGIESIAILESPCFLISWIDITDRKRAEDMLKLAQLELEQRVEERTSELASAYREQEAFNYTVSHDLRGPLRAIDGFSRILINDHSRSLNDEGKDCLVRIIHAANRMGKLVDNLLHYARINQVEPLIQVVNLSSLFADSFAKLQEVDIYRKVQIDIQPEIVIEADPALIGALVDNLASNAWKYTSKRDLAIIRVYSSSLFGATVYHVEDNGAGFDMEYADKLFKPFQRLHSDHEFPGVGIGLATIHRIVSKHKGTIWGEGRVNDGAIFHFTLGTRVSK